VFQKGEYIIYGRSGICRIEDITHIDIPGVDKKRLYYVMKPLNMKGSCIYFPVDKEKVNARYLISEKEAWELLDEIPNIEQIWVSNEKMREEIYKKAMNSCDYRQWVAIIKTLYTRRQDRLNRGKRIATVDERYLKMAEDALYSELAFVLGKKRSEMEQFIKDHIENKAKAQAALAH
jgi:CarD family transcriptional regulator